MALDLPGQVGVHPPIAVDAVPGDVEGLVYQDREFLAPLCGGRGRPHPPVVEAGARDLHNVAQQVDGMVGLLRVDELVAGYR